MFFLKTDSRAHLISPKRYHTVFASKQTAHILIDVRTAEEFAESHIQGAINIPVQGMVNRLAEISHTVPVIVYCRSGARSSIAARVLSDAGFSQVYDLGGFMGWVAQGLPIERGASR